MIIENMTLIDKGFKVGQHIVFNVYGMVYYSGGRVFCCWVAMNGMVSLIYGLIAL